MFPVTELILPSPTPPLREVLGLTAAPTLRRVKLAALQAEIDGGRLAPGSFLAPAEQAAYGGFVYPKRRLEWLGGRLAAKAAALAGTGQPLAPAGLARWQVDNAEDGRPGLRRVGDTPESGPVPELSISHSHGVAAALVVAERPCGLDLQQVTDSVVRVRERFCATPEVALLPDVDPRRAVGLTLLWAAKEALRKARGGEPLTGFLAMRLAGVDTLDGQGWCFRLAVAGAGEYQLAVFLIDDFAVAVSVR